MKLKMLRCSLQVGRRELVPKLAKAVRRLGVFDESSKARWTQEKPCTALESLKAP